MNFLLVLRDHESNWGPILSRPLQRNGAEVVIRSTIAEAEALLRDKNFSVKEIITGSFSDGRSSGPWRELQKVAAEERSMSVTLLTNFDTDGDREQLLTEGIPFIEKSNYNRDKFILERFPEKNLLER